MTKAITTTDGAAVAPTQPQSGAAELIRMATQQGAGVDVIDKMAQLYREEREDQRRTAFNAAMAEAQTEMRPVTADATNPQTRSEYASYAALDKALRPVYTRHGFGLSFDTADTDKPDVVRVVCVVSHRDGYERTHHIDMPADGTGIKGNRMMTATHARGSAATYGMRYLLKMIFNVAIGEDDTDGNTAHVPTAPTLNKAQVKVVQGLLDVLIDGEDLKATLFESWNIAAIEEIRADRFDKLTARLNARLDKQTEAAQ